MLGCDSSRCSRCYAQMACYARRCGGLVTRAAICNAKRASFKMTRLSCMMVMGWGRQSMLCSLIACR